MKQIPKVKICGITSAKDALNACRLGADYLGLIIDFPESPRSLSPVAARKIVFAVREKFKGKVKCVGVFVNKNINDVKDIVRTCGLDICQLHGEETGEYVSELKQTCEVWKAVIINKEADKKRIRIYRNVADKILLDAGRGNGKRIRLSVLKDERIDVLGGGLGIDNIENILDKVSPGIVDANSRLETSPGRKNGRLVEKFIKKVKQPSV